MAWVKRNLGLVIGGVIALALLGVAGFYFWGNYKHDAEITQQLDETTEKFKGLLNRPLHPGGEGGGKVNNIELVKQENKRLEDFLKEVRARFGKREIPTNISNRDFRALLDNTIHELQHSADALGITVPGKKDYWFSFAPQKSATEFKNVEMLTYQLMDVKDLCDIMFGAKISDLVLIKRVAASSDENNATDFLTDKKASTNEYAIVTPYELRFQGFSAELARVLDRMITAKRCFVVRSVAVDRAPAPEDAALANPMPFNPMMRGMDPRYMRMPPPTAPGATTGPKRLPNVLLDENKLLMVLQVEAVRLKEPAAAKPATPRQPQQVAQVQPADAAAQ
jgi:hypothetical protein